MKLNNGAELVACVINDDGMTAGVLAKYLGNLVVWAAYKTSDGWECHSGDYFQPSRIPSDTRWVRAAHARYAKRFLSPSGTKLS